MTGDVEETLTGELVSTGWDYRFVKIEESWLRVSSIYAVLATSNPGTGAVSQIWLEGNTEPVGTVLTTGAVIDAMDSAMNPEYR